MVYEQAFVILKPGVLEEGLVGEILSRFEKEGLRIKAMKTVKVTQEIAEKLYPDSKEQLEGMGKKTLSSNTEEEVKEIFGTLEPFEIGKMLNEWNRKYITSGPVVCIILEGDDALEKVVKIVGHTDPAKAEKGTIRGDLAKDSIEKANKEKRACKNLVHRADSPERVKYEISLFFNDDKL